MKRTIFMASFATALIAGGAATAQSTDLNGGAYQDPTDTGSLAQDQPGPESLSTSPKTLTAEPYESGTGQAQNEQYQNGATQMSYNEPVTGMFGPRDTLAATPVQDSKGRQVGS